MPNSNPTMMSMINPQAKSPLRFVWFIHLSVLEYA